MKRLSDMELFVLNELAKGCLEVTIIRGSDYDILSLSWPQLPTAGTPLNTNVPQLSELLIKAQEIPCYHELRLSAQASKVQDFLAQYITAYKADSLQYNGGPKMHRYSKSILRTLDYLKKQEEEQGNTPTIIAGDIPKDVNLAADLIVLEKDGVLDIIPEGSYESYANFSVSVEIKEDLKNVYKQCGGASKPKAKIDFHFHDLKIMKDPFQVIYQGTKIDIKEHSLQGQLLRLLLSANNYQYSREALSKKLYSTAKDQSVRHDRLKSLCSTLEEKLNLAGCPYKIRQKNNIIYIEKQ